MLPTLLSSASTTAKVVDLESLAVAKNVNKNNVMKTTVINRSVRTGEQIYAKNECLVILGAVNSGAEVLADGDISVFGTLRGRALAGVTGNVQASIYASKFQPELVAIADSYKTGDDLVVQEKPTQLAITDF